MSPPKKIKIEIRPVSSSLKNPALKIQAREKISFTCADCANKYYSFHYFCPQCLGRVSSARPANTSLRILSIPEDKAEEVAHLLKLLCGREPEQDLVKRLRSLPWIAMEQSNVEVLEEWKQTLEAENVQSEIFVPAAENKRKRGVPLFKMNAPLPCFLPSRIEFGVRAVSRSLQNPTIRMKWVEAVLRIFRIVENFYKQDPAGRFLFSDLSFQMEQRLHEAVRDHASYYKNHEEEFPEVINKIRLFAENTESEIHSVRKQIHEQL